MPTATTTEEAPPTTPPPPPYESVILGDSMMQQPTTTAPAVVPGTLWAKSPAAAPGTVTSGPGPAGNGGTGTYESLQTHHQMPGTTTTTTTTVGAVATAANGSSSSSSEMFDVEVTNPTKVGDGMSAYAAYTVVSSRGNGGHEVTRRFSDFTWLRGKLHATYPGVILYPLPEKVVTTSPFNADFLEHRRVGLHVFMRKTCAHPELRHSEDLRSFLQEQGGGGAGGGSGGGAWYQRGAAGTALGAVDSWWQQITTATESFVAGAGVDTMLMEEDPRYLEATEYLLLLEERLKKAVRSSDDVVSAVNTGGLIVGNFGENAHLLGDCEEKGAKVLLGAEAGGLGQAFRQVGAAASALRGPAETQARRLADAFRAPLKRGLSLVQAAKETIDLRADSLLKLQTARARCEQKRVKLEAALSGGGGVVGGAGIGSPASASAAAAATPPSTTVGGGWLERFQAVTKLGTSAQPSIEDMQKDSDAAARFQREAQERYDVIKERMAAELPRLHAQLETDLNAAFAEAAACLKELAEAQAAAWEAVMPGCSQVAPLEPPPVPMPAAATTTATATATAGLKGVWSSVMGTDAGPAGAGGGSGGAEGVGGVGAAGTAAAGNGAAAQVV